jgi:hypothetical protein
MDALSQTVNFGGHFGGVMEFNVWLLERLIMREIQNGSLGNFYFTADVGTAVVMEELGANSTRLPDWLIAPNTMQKCDFSPETKQKLRPDCMIVEITNDEIDRALKKRTRNGDTNVPTQINGRPRNIWLIELGTPLTPGTWTRS